jgi:hypothetical protein
MALDTSPLVWRRDHAREVTKVRAYAIWSLVDVLRMKFGAKGVSDVRMLLTPDRREQLRTLPGQSAWYDYGLYVDVMRSAVARLYGSDARGAYDLSRSAKHLEARRFFGSTGMFESPRSFIAQLRALRSHYLDGGALEGALIAPNLMRCSLSGLASPCAIIAHDLGGGVAGMLEVSGASSVCLIDVQVTSSACSAWLRFDEDEVRPYCIRA